MKPASLSLDLDNLWSYMKTHGDAGWETYPSYLGTLVPRVVEFLQKRDVKITWFIVGRDAAQREHQELLRSIADAGHEVGNHSFEHEQWLHLYSEERIEDELASTEDALHTATGQTPVGFRGPGFSLSPTVLKVLARRGYLFDASTFPTFLGPIARMYYFATATGLSKEEMRQRSKLFGKWSDGLRSNHPYRWDTAAGKLLEIPVTTMPLAKVPIHASYILYLATYSRALAMTYFRQAVRMCRWTGTELSLLLHPLDFLGGDDTDKLSFFPAMRHPAAFKLDVMSRMFDVLAENFELIPMNEHARRIDARPRLAVRRWPEEAGLRQPAMA